MRLRRRGLSDPVHHGANIDLPHPDGREGVGAILSLPDDRRYPQRPILGVGAIVIESGRVLLVERGREPLKGYWSLPGGVLEVGERLADGLCREVREETGLEIELLSVVEIFERILRDAEGVAEYHYVLIDYLCRVTGGALKAGDDVSEVRWVDRTSLAQYRITEGTLPVIEKAFVSGALRV